MPTPNAADHDAGATHYVVISRPAENSVAPL